MSQAATTGTHATHSRPAVRLEQIGQQRAHGIRRRADHVPDHGLHRLRQSADSRQCRHGQGRGVRRHLHRGRGVDLGDGALCQLSDRAGAGHGAQRLLRVLRRADHEIHLAAGARRRVLLRRHLLSDFDLSHSRIHHQFDSEEPEVRHIGRRRPVPRHHRARGIQDRGRQPGDPGHARRSAQARGDPVPARPGADHGAELSPRHRRHLDRHPHRHRDRHSAGPGEIHRHRVGAAVAGADLPAARFLADLGNVVPHRHFQFSVRRRVRQCRHPDRRHPSRRPDRRRRQSAAHETGADRRQLCRHVRRADRHLDDDQLYRERGRRLRRRPHRTDGVCSSRSFSWRLCCSRRSPA